MRRSVDRPFVELMERVYHRFKNALFDYYLGSAPAADEETALVINNYKELIRIQDADQRLLQLVQMAAGASSRWRSSRPRTRSWRRWQRR